MQSPAGQNKLGWVELPKEWGGAAALFDHAVRVARRAYLEALAPDSAPTQTAP